MAPSSLSLAQAAEQAYYDDYMMTTCMYEVGEEEDEQEVYQEESNWEEEFDEDDEGLLKKYSDSGDQYEYGGYAKHDESQYWPCKVLRRDDDSGDEGEATYTVRILPSPNFSSTPWAENDLPRLLTNYPLQSIRYFPRPYYSDQHMLAAFRHPLGLSDDMIPDQWKNVVQ